MHRAVIWLRRRARNRDERGAVAIVVAAALTLLMVVTAMVLDFGLVRVDRQIDKAAADEAAMAGLHGLKGGDGMPHSFAGVCTAIRYLKANNKRFGSVDETTGWKDGLGATTASGCTDIALRNRVCNATNKASWAAWHWAGTHQGLTLDVTIESGYDLPAPASTNRWDEDSLPASADDLGDTELDGCDHLAVTIEQSRRPGLGSVATSSDLVTAIRSVGRVKTEEGDAAPAMLLLKRTGCPVVKTGSNGGGSFIHVLGAYSPSTGLSQGGTIHSDTDGVGCTGGSNSSVYAGLAAHGIVTYAAPLATDTTQPDPAKPGMITSTALANGIGLNLVRDSFDNVYASSALNASTGPGTKSDVAPRTLVTRRLVDERYFAGVKGAIAAAKTAVFDTGPDASWVEFPASVDECKPTQAQVNALTLTSASKLSITCTHNNGFIGSGTLSIPAGEVYFAGKVNPGSGSTISLPNAHHVYIEGDAANAVSIGNSAKLGVNNAVANLDGSGKCDAGQDSSKAVLFVRSGSIKQTAGELELCRTSVFMMGGELDGCVPATEGTAPTNTPCDGALGTSQFAQNGGILDWTAPDTIDATMDSDTHEALPAAVAAWSDPDGPEDLALWSESADDNSSTYGMGGGSALHVRGVFMVPNADPFIISGGGTQNLTNAQYVVSAIELNGSGTNITMSVDPNSAVTLPELGLVGLVR